MAHSVQAFIPKPFLKLMGCTSILNIELMDQTQVAVSILFSDIRNFTGISGKLGLSAFNVLQAFASFDMTIRTVDVNLNGVYLVTKLGGRAMRDAGNGGVIINISSIGGRITFPLGTLYHGTKFAVEGLSESLHFELLPLGIRVKLVEPGMVKTDFSGRSFDFNNEPALPDYQPLVQAFMSALGPMAENASPAELIADTIFGAASDCADRLRYEAGADAVHLLNARRQSDDATFIGGMRSQFGLSA
jgi:NAD(P)-dependent dehydrogenase (short-subunit alcohol dehydrogenase family)